MGDCALRTVATRQSPSLFHVSALRASVNYRKEIGMTSIPPEVARQVLSMGRVEWGATDEFTEGGHLGHLKESLRITRENFNLEDVPVAMHGLYLEGTETVLCHTGTSPNSGANAQALAGAWNWLFDQCASAGRNPEGEDRNELRAQHEHAVPNGSEADTHDQ